jgi:drug/metabolite transporter (DMT)-like permease
MTSRTASLLGIFAILFWSTNIALSRSLTEKLGTLTAAAWLTMAAGLISAVLTYRKRGSRAALRRLSWGYRLGCGALFVGNMMFFYLALGLAATRGQVVEVGIVNYLWVPLILLLAVPIQRKKPHWMVVPGILISLAGVVLAVGQSQGLSWGGFTANLRANFAPYLFALLTAVCWSFYSNLSRVWAGKAEGGAVPLFLIASGGAMFLLRFFFPEHPQWNVELIPKMAFVIIFPTILSYTFWEAAMRRGNLVLVAALSYFIPLFSTLITGLYLHVAIGPGVWLGCLLVIAGAALCKRGIG